MENSIVGYPLTGVYQFTALDEVTGEKRLWDADWTLLDTRESFVEIEIRSSYVFLVVAGVYQYGYYVCVPTWDVGHHLSTSLCNTICVYDKLRMGLSDYKAMSVAKGLSDFARHTRWGLWPPGGHTSVPLDLDDYFL